MLQAMFGLTTSNPNKQLTDELIASSPRFGPWELYLDLGKDIKLFQILSRLSVTSREPQSPMRGNEISGINWI